MKRRIYVAFDVDGFRDEADIGDDVIFGILLEERLQAWAEAQRKLPVYQTGGVAPWEFSEFNTCSSLEDLTHFESVRPKEFYSVAKLPDGYVMYDGNNVFDYGGYRYRWAANYDNGKTVGHCYVRSERIIND